MLKEKVCFLSMQFYFTGFAACHTIVSCSLLINCSLILMDISKYLVINTQGFKGIV